MWSVVRKILFGLVSLGVLLAAALGVRTMLAPKATPSPVVDLSSDDEARLRAHVAESVVDRDVLLKRVENADVVLVGEVHFCKEPMEFLVRLVEDTGARPISLLLELPAETQHEIDAYLKSHDASILDGMFVSRSVLPYRFILEWAGEHPDRVRVVTAMDENRRRIVINRTFLRDTRNETMARHVLSERERNPDHLVVAYGGQLHFTMAGRYLYDVENRVPMGARLVRYGIPRDRIVTVMVSGDGRAPLCDLVQGGVFDVAGALGEQPYALFLQGKIFGAERARELFDYYVDLDSLSGATH